MNVARVHTEIVGSIDRGEGERALPAGAAATTRQGAAARATRSKAEAAGPALIKVLYSAEL
jgi:hypothetical protein